MDAVRRVRGEASFPGGQSRSRPWPSVNGGAGSRAGLLLLALVQFVVIMFLLTHPQLQNPFVSSGFGSFSGSGSGSVSGSDSATAATIASLSGQVSELQAQLLAVAELKTTYRKQWGACTCKYTNKGPRGGYCVSRDVKHDNEILSVELANELISLFNSSCDGASCRPSVWDFGCGVGQYGKYFAQHAPELQWQGFDGAEGVENKTDGRVKFLDLTEPAYLSARDWSMSLEVGEHIPAELEDVFIDNLHRHNTKGIVLSWGIPGQRGSDHINLHPNEYVISKVTKLGYRYDKQLSTKIRETVPISWFKNTVMVFHRDKPQLH